ncbi:MAG: glycosyltransferase family 39 protein [Chitinophagales bacterium]|nr:glycosyltransferase family 39 protein [Chitinophagales bacterium]
MNEEKPYGGKYYFLLLIIIFAVASFLRLFQLDHYPLLINLDELSNIYDGYSISETGKDRSGDADIATVRGFGRGDYRPSLMPFLLAAGFKFFGYSILNGRIIAAILGILSLILLYFFAKDFGGKNFALAALVLATFSPWHLIFSRMAHEGTMLPSIFLLLIMLLWNRSRGKIFEWKSLLLLGFVTGFSVNAYQATKLTGLLIAMFIAVDILFSTRIKKSFQKIPLLILGVTIGALPQILFLFNHHDLFFARSENALIPHHSVILFTEKVFENIFANLNPVYLFFSSGNANIFTVARLLPVEIIFFICGILFLKRVVTTKLFPFYYIYILIIIVILPAAITLTNPHSLRASGFLMLAPLISAAGIIFLVRFFKKEKIRQSIFFFFLSIIIINASIFIYSYANSYSLGNTLQQHGLVLLAEKINVEAKDCEQIYIENIENQPYIYITAFTGITPQQFQAAEKKVNTNWIWDYYLQLGKYYFRTKEEINLEMNQPSNQKRLFIYSKKRNDVVAIDSVLTDEVGWVYFYKKL